MAWQTEIHIEHMVKRKMQAADFAAIAATAVAGYLLFEVARISVDAGVAGGIALVFACIGVYVVSVIVRKEFEYILTQNHLDVDCIYAQSRRRRKITVALENVRTLERYNPKKTYPVKQMLDFSSRQKDAQMYALVCVVKDVPTCIVFEPSGNMLETMRERLNMLGIRV